MKGNNSFIRRIYRESDIKRINQDIKMLGDNAKITAVSFMNIRLVTSIILFILILYNFPLGYIFAPLLTIVYYYLIYFIMIEVPLRRRTRKLDREALQFFEA